MQTGKIHNFKATLSICPASWCCCYPAYTFDSSRVSVAVLHKRIQQNSCEWSVFLLNFERFFPPLGSPIKHGNGFSKHDNCWHCDFDCVHDMIYISISL